MLTFPLLRPRQNYTAKCLASFRLSLELQTFLDFMFIKTLSPSGEWRGQSPLQLTVRLASDLTKSVPSLESDGSTPSWSDPRPCMPEVFGLVPEGEKEKIDEEEGGGAGTLEIVHCWLQLWSDSQQSISVSFNTD